ncbi:LTA synthase family protein [Paenibacillus cremeus]|uniref:LTA synthase family protein n=1 Tax=Paenibacillus cremeus TaxID=2163881 RepID=A0A559KDQ4_9BACL|nr:LTA synthase family protein [Paenibacillus cremeus]TVY10261.1 LTA synthase family protein [Paenibacillus cremeus]
MRPRKTKGQQKSSQSKYARAAHYFTIISALIVVPMLLVFGMELIQRGSIHETWGWVTANPKLFGLNAMLVMFVYTILYTVIGSLIPATGFSTLLMLVVSLVSYFKLKLIGEPLFPWDIFLKKESMNILPLVTSREALVRLGIVFGAVLLIFLSRIWLPKLKLRLMPRVVLGLLSVFALYAFGVKQPWTGTVLDKAGVSEIVWNQKENYGSNGTSLAFTMNVKNSIVPKPDGYSEPTMASLAQSLTQTSATTTASKSKSQQKPNVIFIMNEAFWDPTLMTNVKFSEDPVPTIHRLQQESTSGYLLSPQFGGGTSNVEYEVLTGNSMSFLPAGSIPYQQYINKPIPSLASYFKSQGYNSTAIHSYEGWFWNRENVYKQMDFDQFISKDQFENPTIKGDFIADSEVSKRIIDTVDTNEEPTFIYAVTMQNHGPYDDNRYGQNAITAKGPLSDSAKNVLETYTQGAHDADASLQQLINHFEQSDEPTIIVFYGDHLPMLGYDYDVYAQSGFVHTGDSDQWSLEEQKKMHSVPFVTWTNMALKKEDVPVLSDSFLGAYVLDRLNMEKPAAWTLNDELAKQTPGLLRNLVVDANQELHQAVPDTASADVEKYRELQYDELFGKQYFAKYTGSGSGTAGVAEGSDGETRLQAAGTEN